MKVSVTQSINCAHQLPGTEMHGHTYRITAIYAGDLNVDGMVMPLEVLADHLGRVLVGLNHLQLEDVIGQPGTAERLAQYIRDSMPRPVQIRVQVGDEGSVETE